MKQSAAEGYEYCAFPVENTEIELNPAKHDPEVIEIASVNFDWWGLTSVEDSGPYLCTAPKNSGPLEVKLDFLQCGVSVLTPSTCMLNPSHQRQAWYGQLVDSTAWYLGSSLERVCSSR